MESAKPFLRDTASATELSMSLWKLSEWAGCWRVPWRVSPCRWWRSSWVSLPILSSSLDICQSEWYFHIEAGPPSSGLCGPHLVGLRATHVQMDLEGNCTVDRIYSRSWSPIHWFLSSPSDAQQGDVSLELTWELCTDNMLELLSWGATGRGLFMGIIFCRLSETVPGRVWFPHLVRWKIRQDSLW